MDQIDKPEINGGASYEKDCQMFDAAGFAPQKTGGRPVFTAEDLVEMFPRKEKTEQILDERTSLEERRCPYSGKLYLRTTTWKTILTVEDGSVRESGHTFDTEICE